MHLELKIRKCRTQPDDDLLQMGDELGPQGLLMVDPVRRDLLIDDGEIALIEAPFDEFERGGLVGLLSGHRRRRRHSPTSFQYSSTTFIKVMIY